MELPDGYLGEADVTTLSGAPRFTYALEITGEDNKQILAITPDGKVIAPDIESASAAGKAFVESVQLYWGGYLRNSPITDEMVDAAARAMCAAVNVTWERIAETRDYMEPDQDDYRNMARAALLTLTPPVDAK